MRMYSPGARTEFAKYAGDKAGKICDLPQLWRNANEYTTLIANVVNL